MKEKSCPEILSSLRFLPMAKKKIMRIERAKDDPLLCINIPKKPQRILLYNLVFVTLSAFAEDL